MSGALLAALGALAVSPGATPGALPLIAPAGVAQVMTDPADDQAVIRASADLTQDIARVDAGTATPDAHLAVIAGTIGHDATIDRLVAEHRLDVSGVQGVWEGFVQQVVDHPAPGIDRALVIAGADKRGTIYGIYDLSARIGVSPWVWWADVPVVKRASLYIAPGAHKDHPRVKYRGIFLNDEAPALTNWAKARYGGFNHLFYARMFGLVMRLKGNLMWPAMWNSAFYDVDPLNKATAERYGIIIGTSHHEPLMRAHAEWAKYGHGPWDYTKNAPELRDFWRKGMERAQGSDVIVTIGMRGDGDEPMTQGTAIPLLERIVADQRTIIANVTGKPASETPQMWALYKEVQDYYDKGMRVPDDVTLLFSDDNWGNLRRLPSPGQHRAGGYGIYYHFDYVGGPRNYKWINTTQIERTWDQLSLARASGADRLWIANVGDLKPLELPTSFFLDYAWNPEAWPLARLPDYQRDWAAQQFGPDHAAAIASILDRTARYAARRKFELLSPETWSVTQDREAERVLAQYDALEQDARATGKLLPADAQDAYYELVLHPVEAAANLSRLYITAAENRLHAEQGRADTNALADRAEALFANDKLIAHRYESLAGGKWAHMMEQTHIGYTGWQEPKVDVMPAVRRISLPDTASLGVAVEGDPRAWTFDTPAPQPPALRIERFGTPDRRIALFDKGDHPARFTAASSVPWLRLSTAGGIVPPEGTMMTLTVDWSKAPAGESQATVTIDGGGDSRLVEPVLLVNHPQPQPGAGFVEADGDIAIEAAHFSRSVPTGGASWRVIPGLGRTLSAVEGFPQAGPSAAPGKGPMLEYAITLHQPGDIALSLIASPSLAVIAGRGLHYAIAIDDEKPQLIDLLADDSHAAWNKAVIDAARVSVSHHHVDRAGRHVVRLWMVDPGLSVQRLILSREPVDGAALGAVESEEFP